MGEQISRFPIDFDKIGQIILIVIGMYVISAIFNFMQQFIMTRVSQRTVYEMRRDLDEKMSRLPISYYDTHSNGDIIFLQLFHIGGRQNIAPGNFCSYLIKEYRQAAHSGSSNTHKVYAFRLEIYITA